MAGAGYVCDAPSKHWTNRCPGLVGPAASDDTRVLRVGSCCVQVWYVRSYKADPVDVKAAFTPNLFGAVGSDKLW